MANESYLFSICHIMADQPVRAALFAIEVQENGTLLSAELKYLSDYLQHPRALPLMPDLPLRLDAYNFTCRGEGVPGFIEELLPDAWGRRLIAREIRQRGLHRNPTIADYLSVPAGSVMGCFLCMPDGKSPPVVTDGISLRDAEKAFLSADKVDRNKATEADYKRLKMAGASSPKGARPKLLVRHDSRYWLAKLPRQSDTYDIVGAEHAAMTIAMDAGLCVPETRIASVGGIRALLVERFDRSEQGDRIHMIRANAMLKDSRTQEDRLHASYQDLAGLIRHYSDQPTADLRQLLGLALLNGALRNTDDHLRNFSFLQDINGFRLSPAYDIVPTPDVGVYHQLDWQYSPVMPALNDAASAAKALQIPESEGVALAANLGKAIREHLPELEKTGAF